MDQYCAWCGTSLDRDPFKALFKTAHRRWRLIFQILLKGVSSEERDSHGICLKCLKKNDPEMYHLYINTYGATLSAHPSVCVTRKITGRGLLPINQAGGKKWTPT